MFVKIKTTFRGRNRGSFMKAHVLLNFLRVEEKREKMLGKQSILCLFLNSFDKLKKNMSRNDRFYLSHDNRIA